MKKYQFVIIIILLTVIGAISYISYKHTLDKEIEEKETRLEPIRNKIMMDLLSALDIGRLYNVKNQNSFEGFALPEYCEISKEAYYKIIFSQKDSLKIEVIGNDVNPQNGKPLKYEGIIIKNKSANIKKIN